ncbi:uncharacterized protein B0J16DRAFT_316945 [Fusarium flagelliforme]|uniref:uncharacterized protein n=1 Tax=Fusarium flagelliforme TaxID=2675880 RepID=UPI001E8D1F51|nr:uncharacterized protein B0J16DRAFT_316945 [Fusarium flagelliforme]KAH7193281.1 hypothetical protein B0J16DRAFT_316945 [Fusarium flagelliforme]
MSMRPLGSGSSLGLGLSLGLVCRPTTDPQDMRNEPPQLPSGNLTQVSVMMQLSVPFSDELSPSHGPVVFVGLFSQGEVSEVSYISPRAALDRAPNHVLFRDARTFQWCRTIGNRMLLKCLNG